MPICSLVAMSRNRSTIALKPIAFSSNTSDRDWIVCGTLSSSVVAIMKTTCGGGSSTDLRSASKAFCERRWTSSMMNALYLSRTGRRPRPSTMVSRTLSIPVWEAASISSTLMLRPCAISTHASQVPHGSGVGPFAQFSARARMRASVVLPTPRGPAKMNDWPMRSPASAFRRVCVTPFWPMTSSKRWGRYLRARTW